MVLKGVNWLDNTSHVIWSQKDSFGCTMITLGQMVLKGTYWVQNDKICLERSQLGTQY